MANKQTFIMPTGRLYMPDLHDYTDKVYQLHGRLALFVGEVWAAQIIASMTFYATTSKQSYLSLMQDAVDIAIKLYSEGKT